MTDIHWYVFCHQKDLKNREILEHPEFERTHKGHRSPAKRRWLYWRSTLYSSQGGTWERSPMWGGRISLPSPQAEQQPRSPHVWQSRSFGQGWQLGKASTVSCSKSFISSLSVQSSLARALLWVVAVWWKGDRLDKHLCMVLLSKHLPQTQPVLPACVPFLPP